MNSVFILLNSLNDWKPYCETDSLMTVTDYLEHRYGERTPKLVINLSDEYGCCRLLKARCSGWPRPGDTGCCRASRRSTSSNRAPESA